MLTGKLADRSRELVALTFGQAVVKQGCVPGIYPNMCTLRYIMRNPCHSFYIIAQFHYALIYIY